MNRNTVNSFSKSFLLISFFSIPFLCTIQTSDDPQSAFSVIAPSLSNQTSVSPGNFSPTNLEEVTVTTLETHTHSPFHVKLETIFDNENVSINKNYSRKRVSKLNDTVEDWEAPMDFQKNFPYYLAGHDDEGRPVWIVEIGKFPVRKIVEAGDGILENVNKYATQALNRIAKSIEKEKETNDHTDGAFFVVDFEGFDLYQVTHTKALQLRVKLWTKFRDEVIRLVGKCVVINVNYLADLIINLARPIFGGVLEKVELYGTNPAKWKPVLRRLLPLESLPEWYGGDPNFKPLAVYG